MTASLTYISLTQEATLVFEGATVRLAKANSVLSDFLAEHGELDVTSAAESLLREYYSLLVKRDDAIRQHDKAKFDLSRIGRGER